VNLYKITGFIGLLEGVYNNPILNYPYEAEEQISLARAHALMLAQDHNRPQDLRCGWQCNCFSWTYLTFQVLDWKTKSVKHPCWDCNSNT